MTIQTTIEGYLNAWNEPDAAARLTLLETIWSDDGVYTDPIAHAENRAELNAVIGRFHEMNPGAKFALKDEITAHGVHVRFYWTLHFANDISIPGMDYGELAADGRLSKIVGFF